MSRNDFVFTLMLIAYVVGFGAVGARSPAEALRLFALRYIQTDGWAFWGGIAGLLFVRDYILDRVFGDSEKCN